MVHEEGVTIKRVAPRRRFLATWRLSQDIAKGNDVDLLRTESRLMPRRGLGI